MNPVTLSELWSQLCSKDLKRRIAAFARNRGCQDIWNFAEEVVVDSLKGIWRLIADGRLSPDFSVESFTRLIAKRRLADHCRRKEVRELPDDFEFPRDSHCGCPLEPELDSALRQLRASSREIVIRRFFQNHTEGEIALALGKTRAAVHSSLCRSLTKLRKVLSRPIILEKLALDI